MLTLPMFYSCSSIILASGSPRRQQFLHQLGIEFQIIPARIDERHRHDELPEDFVRRMAQAKAEHIAAEHPDSWIIGADTVITVDGKTTIGKPANDAEAVHILQRLNNRSHHVLTGLCLYCGSEGVNDIHVEKTEVAFANLSDNILEAYVRTGEPVDKAGAYGLQGIGAVLVEEINGSYTNVIGLPLNRLISMLLNFKVIATTFQHTAL